MSILNEVVTKAKGLVEEKAPAAGLLEQLLALVKGPTVGGIPGLMKKFADAGLTPKIQSWMGGATPLPITTDEVTRVLGSTEVSKMATTVGMPAEQVSQSLTQLLPQVVKQLAPGGTGAVGEMAKSVAGKLGF